MSRLSAAPLSSPPCSASPKAYVTPIWIAAPAGAPISSVSLAVDTAGTLLGVKLAPPPPRRPPLQIPTEARQAADELIAWLAGSRQRFTVPWRLPEDLSPFRRDALETVARIPWGETLCYGEVAALAGHPGAARAVGGAMAANPLPLVIPCHRVLAAGGRLGGFTGGLDIKRALLAHERLAR